MNRSIRCAHGFCREVVACPECGDHDRDSLAELRNNAKRKGRRDHPISRRVDPAVPNGYGSADGRRSGQGNANAKVRY